MGVLKGSIKALVRVNDIENRGIGQGQWGIEKGQSVHWSGSMGVLKRVNGVGEGQWGHLSRVMVALKRVNAGIERWGLNGCIEKDQWGHWSGSMRAFKRVNGGVGQGQWGYGEGSGQTLGQTEGRGCWVRGCGSDRRLSYRVVSSTLQGCKLYLAGLQALPCRVASSTLQGCKLYLAGL